MQTGVVLLLSSWWFLFHHSSCQVSSQKLADIDPVNAAAESVDDARVESQAVVDETDKEIVAAGTEFIKVDLPLLNDGKENGPQQHSLVNKPNDELLLTEIPETHELYNYDDETTSTSPLKENGLLVFNEDNFRQTFFSPLNNEDHPHPYKDASNLLLIVLCAPWCKHCKTFLPIMEEASIRLQGVFDQIESITSQLDISSKALSKLPTRPNLAKIDVSIMSQQSMTYFRPISGYPTLKFVLRQKRIHRSNDDNSLRSNDSLDEFFTQLGSDENGNDVTMWEYIGSSSTVEHIVASVLHYYYRMVVTMSLTEELLLTCLQPPSKKSADEDCGSKDAADITNIYPSKTVFTFTSVKVMNSFLIRHGRWIFYRTVRQDLLGASAHEKKYIQSLLEPSTHDINNGMGDMFFTFVQYRAPTLDENVKLAFREYDDLAETFVHRRDVVFMSIVSFASDIGDGSVRMAKSSPHETDLNGSVRVIRTYLNQEETEIVHWTDHDISERGALFNPCNSGNDLSLTQFVITQSTPPLLWFDRLTSAIQAFPLYRRVHVVMFVDMHHLAEGTPEAERERITAHNKHAIRLMRLASIQHGRERPTEDAVFLIVPSTEVRILTTFGIDIWSGLDDAYNRSIVLGERMTAEPVLPAVMITARKRGSGLGEGGMKRYYLHAKEIIENGNEKGDKNVIRDFLLACYEGILSPSIKSEPEPQNCTNESGVQLLTGNSFDPLVLGRDEKHTLVQFYAPTCGHCKRFSVMWNELARLIKALHWDSIIDVMKMDLTENEVLHNGVNVQNFPSVYYFPAGEKSHPIELTVQGDEELQESNVGGISDAVSVVEWMVQFGKFDEEELLRLQEEGQRVKIDDT